MLTRIRPLSSSAFDRATAILLTLGLASCVAEPAKPAAQTPAAVTAAAPAGGLPADWKAAPGNGSPGVDAPPLSGNNLLQNSTFDGGKSLPWMSSFTAPGEGSVAVIDGEYCLNITNKGANPWDAQVRHREMTIQKGHTYSIRFTAHATKPTKFKVKVGMAGPPYAEYWADSVDLVTRPQNYVGVFTMNHADDPTAELAFHMGGPMAADAEAPFMVCIDNVVIDDPQFKRTEVAAALPIANVAVNQVGYMPTLPKGATVKSVATAPLKWELQSSAGAAVASGESTPFGKDPASGEQVQIVDFSKYATAGTGLKLKVGNDVSHPFDIAPDLYHKLKYDALAYFYHNRSGIEIKMPYAGGEQWARPAGHVNDNKVPCAPGSGCDYTLDVSGGWYDAGDHGKYVVNGGISVWTMLNQYERAVHLKGVPSEFGDGKMNIPENKNGVPDILDEARWELDFLIKMQVPAGQKLAGMVHHKMHDKEWTGLALPPHEDQMKRYLQPPSTAATLNVAAVAAQCARIWEKIDKAFSARCLDSAEKAWAAAQKNPAIYAPAGGVGGGPYDDKDVTDEFYWAAAELFITTKKPVYKDFMTKSPHYTKVPAVLGPLTDAGAFTAMTWGATQALGTISLAVVPNALPPADVKAAQNAVKAAADVFTAEAAKQGYRVPFKPGPKGYPWGSNSFIMNNMLVCALANDLTGDAKYVKTVVEGMDYLLGRNPIDQSYVTGYGERPLKNPHHRFWSHQANAKFPSAPPGAVSGGPNNGMEDPYIQAAGMKGCAPQKCFMDHIESWSTNEITINWNAPLAWLAAFLDEKSGGVQAAAKSAPAGAAEKGKGKGKAKGKKKAE